MKWLSRWRCRRRRLRTVLGRLMLKGGWFPDELAGLSPLEFEAFADYYLRPCLYRISMDLRRPGGVTDVDKLIHPPDGIPWWSRYEEHLPSPGDRTRAAILIRLRAGRQICPN